MTHTRKTLIEAELRVEIARIQDGAVSSFAINIKPETQEILNNFASAPITDEYRPLALDKVLGQPRRKPGRPKGSKNRLREAK